MHRSEAEALIGSLSSRGATASTAESCTGGLIGASVTDVPGSSSVFLGGAVTYSNDAKVRVLGVDPDTLAEHGAVSPQVARQMATGAVRVFGSDYAVAVTGIAGPGGATETKPVGLVYIAVAHGPRTVVSGFNFGGDRSEVRSSTVREALLMLTDMVEGRL